MIILKWSVWPARQWTKMLRSACTPTIFWNVKISRHINDIFKMLRSASTPMIFFKCSDRPSHQWYFWMLRSVRTQWYFWNFNISQHNDILKMLRSARTPIFFKCKHWPVHRCYFQYVKIGQNTNDIFKMLRWARIPMIFLKCKRSASTPMIFSKY